MFATLFFHCLWKKKKKIEGMSLKKNIEIYLFPYHNYFQMYYKMYLQSDESRNNEDKAAFLWRCWWPTSLPFTELNSFCSSLKSLLNPGNMKIRWFSQSDTTLNEVNIMIFIEQYSPLKMLLHNRIALSSGFSLF